MVSNRFCTLRLVIPKNIPNPPEMYNENNRKYQLLIYYPVLEYNPNDYNNPIHIQYKSELVYSDVNLISKFTFSYSNTIFEDDSGSMIEDKTLYNYWTIDEFSLQYYYNSEEYIKDPTSNSYLTSIAIAMNKKVTHHIRSYMKLPEVFSSMFSISNIKSSNLSYSNNYLVEQSKSPMTNYLKSPNLSTSLKTPNQTNKNNNIGEKLTLCEYMKYSISS